MVHVEDQTTITTEGPIPGEPALAVGWLDAEHGVPVGACPRAVLAAIELATRNPVAVTRGAHSCPFCDGISFGPLRHRAMDGDELILGNATIEMEGREGRTWRAPTMLAHYVVAHSYAPPEFFCADVGEA